jgi:sensor histidine kinase YesM
MRELWQNLFDLDGIVELLMAQLLLAITFERQQKIGRLVVEYLCGGVLFGLCNAGLIYCNEMGLVSAEVRFYGYLALICLVAALFAARNLRGDRRQFVATALYFSSNAVLVTGLSRVGEVQSKPTVGESLMTYMLLAVVLAVYYLITHRVKTHISGLYWGIMMSIPVLILGIRQIMYGKLQKFELIAYSGMLILLTLITYFLLMRLIRELEQQMALELDNQSLNFQIRQMDNVKIMLESVRKARHELKNNYFLLESLLQQGKYEELETQLRQVVQLQLDGQEMVSTGNRFIDMLLSQKIGEAQQHQIPIVLDVLLPEQLAINQQMLCSLLFNLLDNAIEASMQVSQPDIFVSMHEKKGYLAIEVRNKIDGSVLTKNPRLRTTKTDARHHGIGMGMIRQVVKRCDGQMKILEERGYFVVSVFLPDRGDNLAAEH